VTRRHTPPLRQVVASLGAASIVLAACTTGPGGAASTTAPDGLGSLPAVRATTSTLAPTTTEPAPSTTVPQRREGTVPAFTVGRPWGSVEGLVMFRGNPTRTWYGAGPAPQAPAMQWRFPDSPMCGNSPVGGEDKVWCGSGWTGQPVVWERPDGITEVIFGAYDKAIHFVDASTGERTRPDFPMGDIIKGSVSLDPDGYPLLYAGSRDPNFRIIALDRDEPVELWSLSAESVNGMWNNDWDSNAVIVDDVMFQGGENSYWFAVKLNRDHDDDGLVSVDPDVVHAEPAFTDELLAAVGRQQSVESSTAVFGTTAYFTNSAGRVVGMDVSRVAEGEVDVVFDYWVGDDVDATLVIDSDGMLYVSVEDDLRTARVREVGHLVKLDPSRPDDPLLWGIAIPATGVVGGIWATPALHRGLLYAVTNPGELLVVDTSTGEVLWRDDVGQNAWSSPVVVDETLIVAVDCESQPALRGYDVSAPADPVQVWDLAMTGGCIESTPAVWKGQLFVGSRDGYFYAAGDA
jgi:outer membrane protein assembly factor BamB